MTNLSIEKKFLSDGSITINVLCVMTEDTTFTFSCQNKKHATALIKQLEKVEWIDYE